MATMAQIRALGRKIGEAFHPQRVILFGSHAEGTATEDSDVDLLVVMPFSGRAAAKAAEMRLEVDAPFPVDLLVRTPEALRRRLAIGDDFIREILDRGKVLYEADHR
jgi:predicted nucleotidyltransferase